MSTISSSILTHKYNYTTTFIIKLLIGLLLVNSLFSGVDFSQIGLIKGLSSIADFGLKIILVLVLFVIFKIRSINVFYITVFFFILLLGVGVGAWYHGHEYDKSLSLFLNMFLWFIICCYAKPLERNFNIFRFSLKISTVCLVIALTLYIFASQGVNTKILGGAWLYDENFRFAGTFAEPSLNGYFYGLMFLLVLFSNQKHRLILALMFAVTTYISGAKFSFLIIPLLLCLVYLFRVKGVFNYTYQLIPIGLFVLFISLAFTYYNLFALISSYSSNAATMTYVTRLGFPVVSIWHLSEYPLGSGIFGFKTTLQPFLSDYCNALSSLDVNCNEMLSYISMSDPNSYESFAPKDVLSFIILSYGVPGLFLFICSILLLSAKLKVNKQHFVILMYIVASMLFTLPFRFILFYSFFLFQCYIYRMSSDK